MGDNRDGEGGKVGERRIGDDAKGEEVHHGRGRGWG